MNEQKFNIERLYVKQSSFETIDAPKLFLRQGKFTHTVEMKINHNKLETEHYYEVVLGLTITTNLDENKAFVVKVDQAGIFHIEGFAQEQMEPLLKAHCSNILYPYARHIVSEMSVQGTFPPVTLTPINFDALYQQQKSKEKAQKTASTDDKATTIH